MIKAYLAGIPSLYEGEDIEIRYVIYEDESLLSKEMIKAHYKKPSVVGAVAFLRVLKALVKFMDQEITIIVNDGALCEFIRGTGKTKDKDVQRMVREIQSELGKFDNVLIKDAGRDFTELEKWNEILNA
jgi:hypothetical protein